VLDGADVSAVLAPFPLANGVISAIFAAIVLNRYRVKGSLALLAWGIGLVIFTLASLLQFTSEVPQWGWVADSYRAYYLVAHVNVGVLALGSVFLVNRRWGFYFLAYLVVLTAIFAYFLAISTIDLQAAGVGGEVLGDQPARYFSYPYTVPGTILLVGIAALSWWRTRLSYNLLLAAGFVLAAVGGISARLSVDLPVLLYSLTLVGIVLLFLGFLRSQPATRPAEQPKATTS
jgi:hypothetical protein